MGLFLYMCVCSFVTRLISKFSLACNLNISRGTNEIPSRLGCKWDCVCERASLKFEPRRRGCWLPNPALTQSLCNPHGARQNRAQGLLQPEKMRRAGGIILAQEKYTRTRMHRHIMQIRSQRSPGPCAVRQRFLHAASCVRATFLLVIHMAQVPPPHRRRWVGLADSPSAFCCLEVAILRVCAWWAILMQISRRAWSSPKLED